METVGGELAVSGTDEGHHGSLINSVDTKDMLGEIAVN